MKTETKRFRHPVTIGVIVILIVAIAATGSIILYQQTLMSNNLAKTVTVTTTTGLSSLCWSTSQHDYQRTGYSTENVPVSNTTLWVNHDVRGAFASPIVADSKVFLYSGGYTYAIDALSGSTLWMVSSSIGVQPELTYYNGSIIQGTRSSGLEIIDVATGNVSFITASNVLSVGGGAPIVDNMGIVYFSENHLQKTSPNSPYSTFFAYYLKNRTKLWDFSLPPDEQIGSSAALADGRIIFSAQHGLHALNMTDGQQIWVFPPPSGGGLSGVSVSGGRVFAVGSDGNVYSLNQRDGGVIWKTQVAASITLLKSPVVGGGKVFVSDGQKIYALDSEKGAIIWSSSLGEISSSPTVSSGLVLAATRNGVLYALKEGDGSIAWRLQLPVEQNSSITSAAICDGIVFIASEEGVRAIGVKP